MIAELRYVNTSRFVTISDHESQTDLLLQLLHLWDADQSFGETNSSDVHAPHVDI